MYHRSFIRSFAVGGDCDCRIGVVVGVVVGVLGVAVGISGVTAGTAIARRHAHRYIQQDLINTNTVKRIHVKHLHVPSPYNKLLVW